jgi:hypothetical protein
MTVGWSGVALRGLAAARPDTPLRASGSRAGLGGCRVRPYPATDRVPADVHYGRASEITAARAVTLDAAYLAHPERFVRRPPTPPVVPTAVWINPPKPKEERPQ